MLVQRVRMTNNNSFFILITAVILLFVASRRFRLCLIWHVVPRWFLSFNENWNLLPRREYTART